MKETVEEAAERYSPVIIKSTPFGSKYEWIPKKERKQFINGTKWQKELSKQALQTAINLLKQTTEYDVLDSWKEKVKELEKLL
jgi:hypothetical protein